MRSLRVASDGAHWNVSLDAVAQGADQSTAHQAADAFLRGLAESPIFDERLQPPRRFVPGTGVEITAGFG